MSTDITTIPKKPGETIFGFLMLGLSLFLFWQAYEISGFNSLSSPGALPLATSALMVISSAIALVDDFRRPDGDHPLRHFFRQILPLSVALMIGIILLFAVMLETVGFIITAFVFLVASIQLLHHRSFATSLLVATVALVFIYLIFRIIFVVVLPEGVVPEREIMAAMEAWFE